jgi:hypothetical protein
MTEWRRPDLTDSEWAAWFDRFPEPPRRDRYDLKWTLNRLDELYGTLPDLQRLSRLQSEHVRYWIHRFLFEFEFDQEDPVQVVDPLAVFGVVAMLTSLAAVPFVPVATIGAFVASSGLLGRSLAAKLDQRRRRKLVREIKHRLFVIDLALFRP